MGIFEDGVSWSEASKWDRANRVGYLVGMLLASVIAIRFDATYWFTLFAWLGLSAAYLLIGRNFERPEPEQRPKERRIGELLALALMTGVCAVPALFGDDRGRRAFGAIMIALFVYAAFDWIRDDRRYRAYARRQSSKTAERPPWA
jgi:uncharacterized membrane protein YfcA